MRNGLKIFDADTHVRPSAETIRPHLSAKVLEALPDLESRRVPIKVGLAGEVREAPYRHYYRFASIKGWGSSTPRILGEAAPRENAERRHQKFMGVTFPTNGTDD